MSIVELTCIKCPKGCRLKVWLEENNIKDGKKAGQEARIKSIEGNSCPKGAEYAEKETTNPTRMVTSTVRISGSQFPVLPVRLNEEIPKNCIFQVMEVIRDCTVSAPIKIGDVLIQNVCGLGVNVVAAATAELV